MSSQVAPFYNYSFTFLRPALPIFFIVPALPNETASFSDDDDRFTKLDSVCPFVARCAGVVSTLSGGLVSAAGRLDRTSRVSSQFYNHNLILSQSHAVTGDWCTCTVNLLQNFRTPLITCLIPSFSSYYTLWVQEARLPQRQRASAVIHGHSRSLMLVPIESPCATSVSE